MRKNHAILGIAAFILSLLPLYGVAENLKIGFVDVAKVFDEYPETKKATDLLNREIEARRTKISAFQLEIEKLEKEIEKVKDKEMIAEKKALLKRKREEMRDYAQEARTYLLKREQELTKKIVEKIYEAIKKVAIKEGVSLVMEKGTLLYGVPELDLTENVIKLLKGEKD
jgi:outer membrane protein